MRRGRMGNNFNADVFSELAVHTESKMIILRTSERVARPGLRILQ